MNVNDIRNKIKFYNENNRKLFTTTSLQTHSIVLLHIITNIDKTIPIYFINTGFHFPETMKFSEKVSNELNIKIKILDSPVSKHLQKERGNFLFTTDPDHCCYLNKILPVENLLMLNDVWINGVRSVQSESRRNLNVEESAAHGTIRFHPLIDWTDKMIYDYINEFNLPRNPLDLKGYSSIGCEPCTRKVISDDHRDARWFGLKKTECGLNTDLIIKK